MKISFRSCALILNIFTLSLLMGCSSNAPSLNVLLPNPASEHCIRKGGKLEIVKGESGERSMCHLPDGTVVEEWELFRRDNPQK